MRSVRAISTMNRPFTRKRTEAKLGLAKSRKSQPENGLTTPTGSYKSRAWRDVTSDSTAIAEYCTIKESQLVR